MPWSHCAYAQADLGLCCHHIRSGIFSHVKTIIGFISEMLHYIPLCVLSLFTIALSSLFEILYFPYVLGQISLSKQ